MRTKSANTYLFFGIGVLLVLVILFVLSTLMGWASTRYTCFEFVVGAFLEMLVIPRIAPITYTKYDEKTPKTSRILGTVITNAGTLYFIIEIALAAIFIASDFGPLLRAMYIQAAVMIVYLSVVAFLVANPAESEDNTPKTKTMGSAGGGNVLSTERRDRMIKELRRIKPKAPSKELRDLTDQVIDQLVKSPATSYQSMDEADHQLAMLIGELEVRFGERNDDMARECLQLCSIIIEQRNDLYQKTNKRANKGKPAQAEQGKKRSGVRGRQARR